MTTPTEIERLEKRIENLEKALMAYHGLIQDTLPPAFQQDTNLMLEMFFEASQTLGGFDKNLGVDFAIAAAME